MLCRFKDKQKPDKLTDSNVMCSSIQQLCFHWRCEGVSLCKSGWPEATHRYHVAAISSKLQRIGMLICFQIQLIYLFSFSVFIEYKLET